MPSVDRKYLEARLIRWEADQLVVHALRNARILYRLANKVDRKSQKPILGDDMGRIAELIRASKRQVAEMGTMIVSLQTEKATLTEECTTLKGQVSQLEQEKQQLTDQVAAMPQLDAEDVAALDELNGLLSQFNPAPQPTDPTAPTVEEPQYPAPPAPAQ